MGFASSLHAHVPAAVHSVVSGALPLTIGPAETARTPASPRFSITRKETRDIQLAGRARPLTSRREDHVDGYIAQIAPSQAGFQVRPPSRPSDFTMSTLRSIIEIPAPAPVLCHASIQDFSCARLHEDGPTRAESFVEFGQAFVRSCCVRGYGRGRNPYRDNNSRRMKRSATGAATEHGQSRTPAPPVRAEW